MASHIKNMTEGRSASLIFSFVGFGIFQWGVNFFEPTYWSQFKLKDWIGCATLINHFNGIGEMVNGTTWFLIPLFLFYLMASSTYTIAKKNRIIPAIYPQNWKIAVRIRLMILKNLIAYPSS